MAYKPRKVGVPEIVHTPVRPGQPTKYTPEIGDRICSLVATHALGLNSIIKKYDLPDSQSIYNWLRTHAEFFDKYMKAKQEQAHVLADAMLEVAENVPTLFDKDGNERIDSGMLGRAKLQLDNLRWSASRLAPRYYGEQKFAEVTNKDILDEVIKHKQELDEKNKKEF